MIKKKNDPYLYTFNHNPELKHLVMNRKKKNTAKKNKGKKLTEMAGLAIKHEFYLEASWILSTLFERKLTKVFEMLEVPAQRHPLTFAQLIKRVKFLLTGSEQAELATETSIALIDEIRNWKNQRNDILKDIPDVHVSKERLERLASEGVKLYKKVNNLLKSVKPEHIVAEKEKTG